MWDQQDQLHCVLAVFFRLFNYVRNLQLYKQRIKLRSQYTAEVYLLKYIDTNKSNDLDILLYQNKGS